MVVSVVEVVVRYVANVSLWLLRLWIDLMKYQRLEVTWGCAV